MDKRSPGSGKRFNLGRLFRTPPPPGSGSGPDARETLIANDRESDSDSYYHVAYYLPMPPMMMMTPRGTRGILISASSSSSSSSSKEEKHYIQPSRLTNAVSPIPLGLTDKLPEDNSQIMVRFYDCEELDFGRKEGYNVCAPDAPLLIRGAARFLEILDEQNKEKEETKTKTKTKAKTKTRIGPLTADTLYDDDDDEKDKGIFHIHYPDCAGPLPLDGAVDVDWDKVKAAHAREHPDTFLLVGVGAGKADNKCKS
ncbi:hypothetical protein GGS20DRAFT_554857 [Poronia punctata]|nr:hypothetical protein GGS20DRAFT_554857 [Poronia punctata]